MVACIIDILREVEKLRRQIITLMEESERSEKEKEAIFKALLEKERECEQLRQERDRLKISCRIKDEIIKSGSERKSELLNRQPIQRKNEKR